MLDEMSIKGLAHAHLTRQDALLYCAILYGDRAKGILPAAFKRNNKLTWQEQRIFGRLIGRAPVAVPLLWIVAESLMNGVLREHVAQMPTLIANDPDEETKPSCNLALAHGHEVIISYDSTQGIALKIPNYCKRERII